MVVFDTTTLLLALVPGAKPPIDPATGNPLANAEARVNYLIEKLSNNGEVVLVPANVLTEVLAGAGDGKDALLKAITKGNRFKTGNFDTLAALELALMLGDWYDAAKPRDRNESAAKIKFDRQIVAIGKVNAAHTIYTDDENLAKFAEKQKMKFVMSWDIPEPPPPLETKNFNDASQPSLGFQDLAP